MCMNSLIDASESIRKKKKKKKVSNKATEGCLVQNYFNLNNLFRHGNRAQMQSSNQSS